MTQSLNRSAKTQVVVGLENQMLYMLCELLDGLLHVEKMHDLARRRSYYVLPEHLFGRKIKALIM